MDQCAGIDDRVNQEDRALFDQVLVQTLMLIHTCSQVCHKGDYGNIGEIKKSMIPFLQKGHLHLLVEEL